MSRTATLRGIAGNIQKITLLIALRAGVRRYRRRNKKSAFRTFPKSLAACRTDILIEFAIGGKPTVGTFIFSRGACHFLISFPDSFY